MIVLVVVMMALFKLILRCLMFDDRNTICIKWWWWWCEEKKTQLYFVVVVHCISSSSKKYSSHLNVNDHFNKLFRNETIVFYIDFIFNCLIPFCCCPVWCICEENKKKLKTIIINASICRRLPLLSSKIDH